MTEYDQAVAAALVRIEAKLDLLLGSQPSPLAVIEATGKAVAVAQGYDRPLPPEIEYPDLIHTPPIEVYQPLNELAEELHANIERPEFWAQIDAEPPVDIFEAGPDGVGP